MTPKKSEENSTPVEPTAPPRTIGSGRLGWIGVLVSRIAIRFGLAPVLVRGILVLFLVALVIVAIVLPLSVLVRNSAPVSAPKGEPGNPKPTHDALTADDPCVTLLEPTALADSLGGWENLTVASRDLVFAIVGGYDCSYAFGKTPAGWDDYQAADDVVYLDVTVAPAAIANPYALEASLGSMKCSRSGGECTSIATSGDWWYRLSVRGRAESEQELARGLIAIEDELQLALATSPAPLPMVVQPFDCASANTGRALAGSSRGATAGSDELSAAASLLAAPVTCDFSEPAGEGWRLAVYPGGAAAYAPCTHNGRIGSPLSVEGVASVFALEYSTSDYSAAVCATDGTSTVRVTRSPAIAQSLGGWDEQALDVLSELLVPVFAAIVPSTTYFSTPATSAPATIAPLASGDCSVVLDPSALAGLAGGALDAYVVTDNPQLELVGGIDCTFYFGTQDEGVTGYVRVSAAPSAIVVPAVLSASLAPMDCYPHLLDSAGVSRGSECDAIAATAGGWWYSLEARTGQSVDDLRGSFTTIVTMLESSLQTATAPAGVDVVQPFHCWDTETNLSWVHSRELPAGSTIAAAAFLMAAPSICTFFTSDGQDWALTIYPGHASALETCIASAMPGGPPASPIAVEGVESVVALDGGGSLLACATDGTSSVRVYRSEGGTWDAATRATLSSLLVPVFEAAS